MGQRLDRTELRVLRPLYDLHRRGLLTCQHNAGFDLLLRCIPRPPGCFQAILRETAELLGARGQHHFPSLLNQRTRIKSSLDAPAQARRAIRTVFGALLSLHPAAHAHLFLLHDQVLEESDTEQGLLSLTSPLFHPIVWYKVLEPVHSEEGT